jgi:hypothetical protein
MPLIYRMHLRGYVLAIGAVVCAVVSVYAWLYVTLPVPFAQVRRDDSLSNTILVARVGAPFFLLASCIAYWACWIEFRVTADGLEFRYLFHTRRYRWEDLASVRVQFERVQVSKYIQHHKNILEICPHKGLPIGLDLQEWTSLFGDSIVAVAAQAGFRL